MFARIFKNSFIINSSIPTQITCNYEISKEMVDNDYDIDLPFDLMTSHENSSPSNVVFFQVKDSMFNPILVKFCNALGLHYDMYKAIIDQAFIYGILCCRPYQPEYTDKKFRPLAIDDWNLPRQDIPWNYGILPLEYWVNHVGYDEYATKVYTTMLNTYKRENKISDDIHLEEFISSTDNNMCFNTEFSYPMFNKKLMLLLKKRMYILRGIESNITEEFLEEYNRKHNNGNL